MLSARPTIPADLPLLHDLFMHTVRAGGTTAHEELWDLPTFKIHYFDEPAIVHSVLHNDVAIGFQAVFSRGEGLSIGSFTDQRSPVRGAGRVLFSATYDWAVAHGYNWIDATIRADNVPGLAYYSALGFEDIKIDAAVPLQDGTPVDRVTKRLVL